MKQKVSDVDDFGVDGTGGDLDITDNEDIFAGDLMYEFELRGVEGDDGKGSLDLGIMAFLSELVIPVKILLIRNMGENCVLLLYVQL
ncbi:hypothetical protein Tco_1522522 [Tanacetum coccineum]